MRSHKSGHHHMENKVQQHMAIQAHGGGGVSEDFGLANMYAHARTLRLVDGPDEVHRNAIAKLELAKYVSLPGESLQLPVTRS